ncbi:MAG TPA: esterase-like activity of phytase family protein [Polyangiaceae bacterium]|nr:esterase-like activity of phytase family protein [Polyangiaceae bacterium]
MTTRRWGLLGLSAAILSTACSGNDGDEAANVASAAPLLASASEPAGENCEFGGTRLRAGRDEDEDGQLSDAEVESTVFVCLDAAGTATPGPKGDDGEPGEPGAEGEPGEPGAEGEPGEDAPVVLLETAVEPSGPNCTAGGVRVQSGIDADEDGSLDAAEVSGTTYVCSGSPGTGSVAGFRLVSKITGLGGPIAEIASASPDGKTLAFTSSNSQLVGFVDITNPASPIQLGTSNVGATVAGSDGEPTSVAFSPDGQHVVVVVKDTGEPIANADPGALVVIDVATRAIVGQLALGVGPDSVAITPDGTKAVIAIEDEENEAGNGVAQARPGSVQVVTLNYANPSASTVVTIALTPAIGNQLSDPQPEYVDITADGKTAIVSLQENNVFAVIDLTTNTVTRYIDAGTSVHAKADLLNDKIWNLSQPFVGQLQPDGVCLLGDEKHFISANEGDTATGQGGFGIGGRGFSVFSLEGARVYDSGDALEQAAFRSGAYPDARSNAKGVEPEGCAAGIFGGRQFAFVTGERNSSVFVIDATTPASPVITQVLGAPMRPESALALTSRNLLVVAGEGNVTGGGLWIYEAVSDLADAGHGEDVYQPRTGSMPFGALSALAYDEQTSLIWGIPDNAFLDSRIWAFAPDHGARRMDVVSELRLRDASGAQLQGIDPEGLVFNPEGGFIVATEGVATNGAGAGCTAGIDSNRVLFFDAVGQLDPSYGTGGIVDLPCGAATNAFDWATMGSNGFEGVTVVDGDPSNAGGLKVYVAFQRPLTGQGMTTRIGEYDVDSGVWNFYYYTLDADVPGVAGTGGNTFLSELIHVGGDKFAVIERDQGWAGGALNKTVRTFTLSSGVVNDPTHPVAKTLAVNLLTHPFRFDQEKLEGLALGGGVLWVVNDNDGGQAQEFFLRLSPTVLGGASEPPEVIPDVVLSEVNSNLAPGDWIELRNRGATPADISGWQISDVDAVRTIVPANTIIPAGGYLQITTSSLGSADTVEVATSRGTLVDQTSWTSHAISLSRCRDSGLRFWVTDGVSGGLPTPGLVNDCQPVATPGSADVVLNEVFSNGTDFVELYNKGAAAVDISNWLLTDADVADPTHWYVIPAGTTIPAGGYYVIEAPTLPYGLGGADSATLYTPYGATVDSYSWTSHVNTAGRCPDGTGAFVTMTNSKGVVNVCPI